jgi:hypothetical protein
MVMHTQISFDIMYWPNRMTKLQAFLEILIESNNPFFWAHATPQASVEEKPHDLILFSGIGYYVK